MISEADLTLYGKIGAALAGAIWVAFYGRGWFKRSQSADGYIVAQDKAAVDMLKRAMDSADNERQRADEAYRERNVAMQELGTLRAQVKSLEEHRVDCDRRIVQAENHCNHRIEEMERQLDVLRGVVERRLSVRQDSDR